MLKRENPYRELEKAIGYRFKDRDLLEQALIHPSYRYETKEVCADNQRLEFLGDAVLALLTASHLYQHCGAIDEGGLTQRRSQVTSGKALAAIGESIGIGTYLKMGKGEARSGGHNRQRNRTDALEALFGAAWLDGGLRAAQKVFAKLLVPALRELDRGDKLLEANPKGRLQELAQSRWKQAPIYELLATTGPAHKAEFTVEVVLPDGRRWAGRAGGRQGAEVLAARRALDELDTPSQHS